MNAAVRAMIMPSQKIGLTSPAQGARDEGHHEVVDDLLHRDRQCVRGEDDAERGPEAGTGMDQRERREGVAEQERERDRQRDRAALVNPRAVPIMRPRISPIAQPVRQCRVVLAAMLLRESIGVLLLRGG